MSLSSIVSSAVRIADNATNSLQDKTVVHEAWIGETGDGTSEYAFPVVRKALVDLTASQAFTSGGVLVKSKATVTFLEPIPDTPPNDGQDRVQPIDPRDLITLPDGTMGPIVSINSGLIKPETHRPFLSVINIG
jgi:hypothetical protein